AEGESFVTGMVAKIVLQCETLQPFLGKPAFAQFRKEAAAHQLIHARLNNLALKCVDKILIFHDRSSTKPESDKQTNSLNAAISCQEDQGVCWSWRSV